MKKLAVFAVLTACSFYGTCGCRVLPSTPSSGYPVTPVPFTSVKVSGSFWGTRLEASRNVTIPLAFRKCEENERYANFVRAANPSDSYKVAGFSFDDTDVYKTIEGAAYCLAIKRDARLENYIDSVVDIMAAAQEPDGYLYTARTQNPKYPHPWAGERRWEKVEDLSHEFYNLGHMLEGAIAYYQATGKNEFLDIAVKYADCVCRNIGDSEGKLRLVPGHQIAEMALVRLYLLTGNSKYLDQARFFLEARGTTARRDEYSQSHKPVLQQDEAVGHAVRATYMYAGMADVAAVTGDSAYIHAIDRIWDNIVTKKMYITGGIGARHAGEAFGNNYELPNASAYNETCAAIGNVYTNYRLFLLHGDSRYFDVLERTLYNGLISGVSIDGGSFFYPNPLASFGNYSRKPWFGCACCPSNISRFIPSLPGYIYAVRDNAVYINLFMPNSANISVMGKDISLSQQTNYPWDGNVRISIDKGAGEMAMKIRIPGWVRNVPVPGDLYSYYDTEKPEYTLTVNGEPVCEELNAGYMTITREWKKGDVVEVNFDMPVRMVKANDRVVDDRGRLAVERGPLVYCAEWPDNNFNIHTVLLNRKPVFEVAGYDDDLGGIRRISTKAQSLSYSGDGYLVTSAVKLTLIPYYAWAHRGEGDMCVWLPAEISAASASAPAVEKQKENGFFN